MDYTIPQLYKVSNINPVGPSAIDIHSVDGKSAMMLLEIDAGKINIGTFWQKKNIEQIELDISINITPTKHTRFYGELIYRQTINSGQIEM